MLFNSACSKGGFLRQPQHTVLSTIPTCTTLWLQGSEAVGCLAQQALHGGDHAFLRLRWDLKLQLRHSHRGCVRLDQLQQEPSVRLHA